MESLPGRGCARPATTFVSLHGRRGPYAPEELTGVNSRSFRGLATPVVIKKLQNFTIDDFGLVSWDCMSSALDDQLFAVRNCLR
jgi:hypothetical protein